MSEKPWKSLENPWEGEAMHHDANLARQALHEAFADAGETVKERIAAAARKLKLPYERVRALWYGQARRIEAYEMEAIRHAQKEARITVARLSRLRTALACTDPDFFGPDIAALEQIEREARRFLHAAGAVEDEGGET